MINTYMNVSAQELIEGCLQPDEEAWWAFYERFGGMLQRALRRALGARAADASVVDEVMQDVRLCIYDGRIGLAGARYYAAGPRRNIFDVWNGQGNTQILSFFGFFVHYSWPWVL